MPQTTDSSRADRVRMEALSTARMDMRPIHANLHVYDRPDDADRWQAADHALVRSMPRLTVI